MKKYVILFFSAMFMCFLLSGCMQDNSYRDFRQARQDMNNYFSENKDLLEDTKNLILKNQSADGITLDKVIHISYNNPRLPNTWEKANIVKFMCGNWSTAISWGQDWGVYYTDQGVPLKTIYMDTEYEEIKEITNDGRTYFWINQKPDEKRRQCLSERINENWFLYYNDWEGDCSFLRERFDEDDIYGIKWHKAYGFK